MVFLVKFSRYISIPILTEWLSGKALVYLDTAFCSHQYRPVLVSLFQSHESFQCAVFDSSTVYPVWLSIVDWAHARHFSNYLVCIRFDNRINEWNTSDNLLRLKSCVSSCTALQLSKFGVDTSIVDTIGPWLSSLKVLVCSEAKGPMNLDVKAFAQCPSLTVCNFAHCHSISSESIIAICRGCISLTSLNLWRCSSVNDQVVSAIIVHSRKLMFLDVFFCPKLSRRALAILIMMLKRSSSNFELDAYHRPNLLSYYLWNNPDLTRLDLSMQMLLGDDSAYTIAAACTELVSLNLNKCSRITDDGMLCLVTSLVYLRVLDIQSLKIISDQTLSNICTYCHCLEELLLYENSRISNRGLQLIGTGSIAGLKSLTLKALRNFDDGTLHAVVSNCSHLTYLNISCNRGFSDDGLLLLWSRIESLKVLNIQFCPSVSAEMKKSLSQFGNVVI